jgi:hypothetical protein
MVNGFQIRSALLPVWNDKVEKSGITVKLRGK